MRGPSRPRRHCRRLIALAVVPPLFWALVLLLFPTGWAARIVERRVEELTGCPTALAALRFGPLGGIRLEGLAVREPGAGGIDGPPPWVEAGAIDVDLSLADLLLGRVEPTRVEVRDLDLRLVRGRDGAFAPWFLLRNAEPADLAVGRAGEDDERAGPIAFRLVRGRVAYVDVELATTIEVDDLDGSGTWWPSVVAVDDLSGTLNGGTLALAVELERGPTPAFAGQLEARGVHLGRELGLLAYLVPYLAGASDGLEGRLDLDLELKGQGASGPALRDSLAGRGKVRLDPIRLDGSSLLVDLARVLPATQYGKIGTLRSDFLVADRKVVSRRIQLDLGGTPIVLEGGAAFDGRISYRLDTGPLAGKLGPDALALLGEAGVKPEDLLELRVTGTTDRPLVHVGGQIIDARDEGRAALEEYARRLRDRLLR
ncbi:AsmA family protein [Tautonia plasticadhaerens]|uniref:AsmA family protein n=1 Tax=Tautonia plasticadhaerens TaxID=2527974 RepID=A0A518H5D0_9BACT|nr:AsmA-like C-terminal region-containing protein [Tautonia plasticadhaerens]QDV36047.1 AsmA family protein [Tautonia plasticadhaerens]